MKAKVIRPFMAHNEIVEVGTVLNVPRHLFPLLKEYISREEYSPTYLTIKTDQYA